MRSREGIDSPGFSDPTKDPEVVAAASQTRFGWGESLSLAYKRYLSLMGQRGFSEEEALAALKEINSMGARNSRRDSNEAD